MTARIHPTAVVHPTAIIHPTAEIGPYTVIGEEVSIGAGTVIGPHCVIEFADIGENNKFVAFVFAGTAPQDLSYKGERTKVKIGNGNTLREGFTIHRGTSTKLTSIGDNCLMMVNSHVGHDCRVGNNVIIVNSTGLAGHVVVEDKAFLSGMCGMHQFTKIGTMAMVSGGSFVPMDILPYCRAQGTRAKLVGLNIVAMRRNNMPAETIRSIKDAYKTLFFRGLKLAEAIEKIKSVNASPEAVKMAEFCETSKRGIARPRMIKGKPVETDE